MDNKKEMERAELHRAIWQIANDLRGSVDGWDFKQYVLGTLFYRYISEKLTNYLNAEAREVGDADFDYAVLSDAEAETERESLVTEQGYFIPPSELLPMCGAAHRRTKTSTRHWSASFITSNARRRARRARAIWRDSSRIST